MTLISLLRLVSGGPAIASCGVKRAALLEDPRVRFNLQPQHDIR